MRKETIGALLIDLTMNFFNELKIVIESHNESPIVHASKRHLGIILTIVGYLFFSMYTVFFQIETNNNHGLNSSYMIFFEFAVLHTVMFITYLVFCLSQGRSYLKCNRPKFIIIRSILGVAALVLNSLARVWTPSVDNSILYSTDAFWLVILLYFLKIKLPKGVWLGTVIGTLGIGFVLYFDYQSLYDFIGGLFGILAGICLCLIIFLTRYMVRRDPPLRIGFYNSLFGIIFFIPATLIAGSLNNWNNFDSSSIILMVISGFIWGLALFVLLEAFYYTENHILAAVTLFLPLFMETFNYTINKQIDSWSNIVGSTIMSIGGLIVIIATYFHDKKHHHTKKIKQIKLPEVIEELEKEKQ
ncbi:MAG: hypothetical protein S4CHLAM20_14270 [Chlamydiia bacterium]|nr:hypothetical protein [Chlamydiia bacterium]